MQICTAYTGWISHRVDRFGLPLPWEQGLWLASKNNCPVKRNMCLAPPFGKIDVSVSFSTSGFQRSGRECGLISAVALLHWSVSSLVSESTMCMSLLSFPRVLQLTLSPLLTFE